MYNACNESLIGRLREGNMDERGGEENKDNREVHKDSTHATCCFPQERREVVFIDAQETIIRSNFKFKFITKNNVSTSILVFSLSL
jgi:hypothetical protein